MTRNAAAGELQAMIAQLQSLAERAERLAEASGGLVDPGRFRAMRTPLMLAAGDLDMKGLLVHPEKAPA